MKDIGGHHTDESLRQSEMIKIITINQGNCYLEIPWDGYLVVKFLEGETFKYWSNFCHSEWEANTWGEKAKMGKDLI